MGASKGTLANRAARKIACSAVMAAALVAGGSCYAKESGDLRETPPHRDAYAYDRVLAPPPWDRAVGVVLSLGSAMFNTVLFPAKLVVGIAGAELGGAVGFLTGGDLEAAAGIWNVTTDGAYGTNPARLDGRASYDLGGDVR